MSEPHAEALRLLERDDREHAVELLVDAHRTDPADFRVTHALALMTLWQLVNGGEDDWRLCIGLWANLLADSGFWAWFTTDAARRYRTEVPSAEVDAVRDRLEHWLHDTVTRGANSGTAALLALEVRAARLVAVRGGIPAGATKKKIPCGPLLIDHLELHDECRELVARLNASRDERNRRTAKYFSQLGPARMLLDQGAPLAALTSLEDLRCADCPASGEPPRLCRTGCPAFARQNPAYAHAVGGRKKLRAEAVAMTVEAHLSVAETAVTAPEPDLRTAGQHWTAAIRQGADEQFRCHVTDIVLPRARFFLQKRRYDDAIDVLTAVPVGTAEAVFGADFGEVTRMLSELLAQRGVQRADPDALSALADLRRAAELNPLSWYACRNLVVLLQNAATQSIPADPADADFGHALVLMDEARTVLRAFPRAGKDTEIGELMEQLASAIGGMHNAQALNAHERGDHDHALEVIGRALTERPGDSTMLMSQAMIKQAKAFQNRARQATARLQPPVVRPAEVQRPAPRPKQSWWRKTWAKIRYWVFGAAR
ncbi:hypothetical protein FKR81_31725 [Lentzea tibetensis]|uniref:Tetratricopeptide repeat protein n=1 Tax=Lentzea tibetensis TaxID=2591470 RepID=A0A563EKR7_9PSEU|nr:hypothetical protein [Lentzea tibetensis]TWP47534.1 hypothetical protein FKR81_31725 [Lentzea tibetensis]